MTERRIVTERLFNGILPGAEHCHFAELVAWADEMFSQIPEEHRKDAYFDVRGDCDYVPTVEVSYDRPETDEEVAARLEQDRLARLREIETDKKIEECERAELRRLLDKYGVQLTDEQKADFPAAPFWI